MHRYFRGAELLAVALVAAALSFPAALPQSCRKRSPPAAKTRRAAGQADDAAIAVEADEKCSRGKPAKAWGAYLVPADTPCFETAKSVGIVFRGPMQFDKAEKQFFKVVAEEAGARWRSSASTRPAAIPALGSPSANGSKTTRMSPSRSGVGARRPARSPCSLPAPAGSR